MLVVKRRLMVGLFYALDNNSVNISNRKRTFAATASGRKPFLFVPVLFSVQGVEGVLLKRAINSFPRMTQ